MDRLDQLFAFAVPHWDRRTREARARGADLSRLVAVVFEADGRVRTAVCDPELAAARYEAFSADLVDVATAKRLRETTTPIALAAVREGRAIRLRERPLVFASGASS